MTFPIKDLKALLEPTTSTIGVVVDVRSTTFLVATASGGVSVRGDASLAVNDRVVISNGYARKAQAASIVYQV